LATQWAFLIQSKANIHNHWIITLFLKENRLFFAENKQKQLKLVIITLTPDYFGGLDNMFFFNFVFCSLETASRRLPCSADEDVTDAAGADGSPSDLF
jgi:hypothetical protein